MNANNVNIRETKKLDYPRLKEIGMQCYDKTISNQEKSWLTRLLFSRYFSKRKFIERERLNVMSYVILENDYIVGFYELEENGCLTSLYIDCYYQKKGYGKRLLIHAQNKAKEKDVKEIYLDASRFGHGFYLKMGFKDQRKPKEVLGVWMVTMKKEIL